MSGLAPAPKSPFACLVQSLEVRHMLGMLESRGASSDGACEGEDSSNRLGADVGDHLVNAESGFRESDSLVLPLLLCCFTKNDSMSQTRCGNMGAVR